MHTVGQLHLVNGHSVTRSAVIRSLGQHYSVTQSLDQHHSVIRSLSQRHLDRFVGLLTQTPFSHQSLFSIKLGFLLMILIFLRVQVAFPAKQYNASTTMRYKSLYYTSVCSDACDIFRCLKIAFKKGTRPENFYNFF